MSSETPAKRGNEPTSVEGDEKKQKTEDLPLHAAVKLGDVGKLKDLLKDESIEINTEDENGVTALIEACIAGNSDMVKLLLERGCPSQPPPPFLHTPLRGATVAGQAHIIPILLKAGADPNAKSDGARTPLMGACFLRKEVPVEKSVLCVKALLDDSRTDPTPKNSFGETALDLAKVRGYEESIKLVKKAVETWEGRKK